MGVANIKAAQHQRERTQRKVPENLERMDAAESEIRAKAVAAIEADAEMMDHVELIEAIMDTLDFFSRRASTSLDQETVQLLGARMFNDFAAAYGQLLRGYCQISAFIQRDLMEIVFLLGMFDRDPSAVKTWRESDHKTRREKFQPGKVRDFLDTYDGFKEGKRGQAYRMFCEYAAHATYAGFVLMGPSGGKPTIGPFFDLPLTKSVLVELAQLAAQAGNNFTCFFDSDGDVPALETKLRGIEVTMLWAERYFGRKADIKGTHELRKMLSALKGQA
jgi:hypothetical protein